MPAACDCSFDRAATIDDCDTKPQAGAVLWCDVWYVCLNVMPRNSGASNRLCGLLLFSTPRVIGSSAIGDTMKTTPRGGGYYDLGGGKRMMLSERGIKLPLTMGHENVGEVVASGPNVNSVKVGDV